MSLYLPEQKLGSHSQEGGSSNKFVLKGRQTGTMHRGHTWVFRAESHDTMMAWYDDIKTLTERTPEERSNLVRGNSRSISRTSQRSSISSDGVVDDDEDPPFAATVASVNQQPKQDASSRRPSGGRFPSDLQVNAQRGLQVPISPLSVSSGFGETPDNYFATESAPPGNQFGRQPPATQEASQAHRGQRDDLQYATNIDGLSGETNQIPRTVGPVDNSALTSANTTMMYTNGDGLVRGEPIHVPTPISKQGPQTPPQGDGRGARKAESQAAWGEEKAAEPQMNGDVTGHGKQNRPGGTTRNDSVPTISHLHIPGEYPRGANAGL